MTHHWEQTVNQASGANGISDVSGYVSQIVQNESPIDIFYNNTRDMIRVANPLFLSSHLSMGPLLLVGVVSATENYFRDMLARIITLCPIAKSCSSEQSINLGSVVWHTNQNIGRGAFEHISFAGSDAIGKTCRNFIKFDISKNNSIISILQEFDKVCEFRHGIVHSNSILPGKNALKLGLEPTGNVMKITIGYNELQECAYTCTALITTFNTLLYNEVVRRWATEWRRLIRIDDSNENKLFKKIWDIFHSTTDERNGLIPNKITMIRCKNLVKRHYGL